MTNDTTVRKPARYGPRWLAVGLLSAVLGIVALAGSAALVMLEDGGWPWHASIGDYSDGQRYQATVVTDDGKTSEFVGTEPDTRAWLKHKQDELKKQHSIPEKVALGYTLRYVSGALLALALGVLGWRLIASLRRRPAPDRS